MSGTLDVNGSNIRQHVTLVNMPKPTPKNRRTYHHGHLREALVEAALALVNEEQSWNFTLRDLARRAGVSHTAPYRHFADKAEILNEIARIGFETLAARLREAVARAARLPLRARLEAVAVAYVRFALRHAAHYRVMFGPVGAANHQEPAIAPAADAAFTVVEDLLAQLVPKMSAKDVERVAEHFWALVHGYTMLALDGHLECAEAGAIERETRAMVKTLLDGLLSRR